MDRLVRLAGSIVVIGMLVPGAMQTAWAQALTAAEGIVDTVAFGALPESLTIEVTLYDDTDLDLAIRAQTIEALHDANHAVADGAPYELSLKTAEQSGKFSNSNPNLGELSVGGDVKIEMNVWSSTQDSLLGGRQSRVERQSGSFQILARLRDRTDGRVVWEGRATVARDRAAVEPATRNMVDALVEHLGRTAQDQSFPAQ